MNCLWCSAESYKTRFLPPPKPPIPSPSNHYLCVQVVGETVDELALYGVLPGHEGQVVGQLVVRGDDGAMAECVKLRSPSTAKDLHDV